MATTVEVTNAVEPFDGEAQAGQQPDQQQAAPFIVANVFQVVAVLGVVTASILNLPTALGHAEDGSAADPAAKAPADKPELTGESEILTGTNQSEGCVEIFVRRCGNR